MKGKYAAIPLLVLLVSSICIVYASQIKTPNTVTVWISNGGCMGLVNFNNTSFFVFAPIKNQEVTNVRIYGNGLQSQVELNDTRYLSMCEGIVIWANDSLRTYQFPIIFDSDDYFIDKMYLSASNIHTTAAVEGKAPITVETFNPHGAIADQRAYAYVDLNTVEKSLSIKGNMSYTLSATAYIFVDISLPPFLGLSSEPTKITEEKALALGTIIVTCVNGVRQNASIDFPYITLSFPVQTPYIQTVT